MGIIGRILQAIRMRGVRSEGRTAGRGLAMEVEERWSQMKAQAGVNEDPAALKARFLGWMQGLHGHLTNVHAILQTPEAEFQDQWRSIVTIFAGRFRSEVLSPTYAPQAEQILSDADIAAIATNVDAVVDDLRRGVATDKEVLLDRAVSGIRAAEAAGRLSPDLRPDAELKESIRRMWEEESNSDER
jgi:hypothetical protein